MEVSDLMAVPALDILWDGEQFLIDKATNAHKLGLLQIAGVRFVGKGTTYWSVPFRYAPIYAVSGMFECTWSPEAHAAYTGLEDHVKAIEALRDGLPPEYEAVMNDALAPFGFVPKPNQASAMVQIGSAGSAAIFSGVGQGKTPTVCGAVTLYKRAPILVVAKPSILYNWQKEAQRFGIDATVVEGTPAQRAKIVANLDVAKTPMVIVTYDILKTLTRSAAYGATKMKRCNDCGGKDDLPVAKCETHSKEFNEIQWAVVVADEAHALRDPSTARRRAFAGVRTNADTCILLTGTPVEDSPEDMWSMLNLLDPIEWPSIVKFKDRYCDMQPSWHGPDIVAGLNPRTRSEFDAVTKWRWRRDFPEGLPETMYETRYCHLSTKERKAYDQMDKQMRAEVGNGVIEAENPLVKSTRLYQMAQGLCDVDDAGEVFLTEHSSKLSLMMDVLEDVGHEPVLIWFGSAQQLRHAENLLEKAGRSFRSIHGGTAAKRRQDYVDAFQSGAVDLILLQVQAGGEGITLTRGRVSIIVSDTWSNTLKTQAKGRNERYGSEIHDELLCIDLVAVDTIEMERMPERRAEKSAKAEEVIG